jgi:hypothetical protein
MLMKSLLIGLLLFAAMGIARAADLCQPPPGLNNYWCDQTFTITGPVTIQSGNKTPGSFRQYLQVQNNSDVASPPTTAGCVVCFGAAAYSRTCSVANGGTYLRPGQVMYRSAAGLYGPNQVNSLYFNSDISAVNVAGTCSLSVSIDG